MTGLAHWLGFYQQRLSTTYQQQPPAPAGRQRLSVSTSTSALSVRTAYLPTLHDTSQQRLYLYLSAAARALPTLSIAMYASAMGAVYR